MLLDTGGGLTVVTPATAAAIGCHPWGRLTGLRMRGDRVDMRRCDRVTLSVEGRRVHRSEAGVWDFGTALPKNAPPLTAPIARGLRLQAPARLTDLVIDGDIGEPVLRRWVITVDLAHGKLWLAPAAGVGTASATHNARP